MTEEQFRKGKQISDEILRLDSFIADYIKSWQYHHNETTVVNAGHVNIGTKSLGEPIAKEIYEFTRDKIIERIEQLKMEFKNL